MEVTKIDHLVLTVQDIEETKSFYQRVLGMEPVVFGNGFEPKATHATPGSADLCLSHRSR